MGRAANNLENLYERVRMDKRWDHLRGPGIRLVPGRGQTESPVAMVVGEAPGAYDNTQKRLFTGLPGRVLEDLMELAELRAEPTHTAEPNAYITAAVKYRLPGNRRPTPDEISWGAGTVRKEWEILGRPSLIVALGATVGTSLALVVGGGATVQVQYPPIYGVRVPEARATMEHCWEEMAIWLRRNV